MNTKTTVCKLTYDEEWKLASRVTLSANETIELKRFEYRKGKLHGVSCICFPSGVKKEEFHWRDGEPFGQWRWWNHDGGLTMAVDFEKGIPRRVNGMPIKEFTSRFAEAQPWSQQILAETITIAESDCTLSWALGILNGLKDRRIYLNARVLKSNGFDLQRRFSLESECISVGMALLLLLRECGLVCDYRYEQFIITTHEDAQTWRDRTGVKQLKPPPDSPWGRALATHTGASFETLAVDMLKEIKATFGVKIRLDPWLQYSIPERSFTLVFDQGKPLRHELWILLGRENLTCEMAGDTLVIKPLDG